VRNFANDSSKFSRWYSHRVRTDAEGNHLSGWGDEYICGNLASRCSFSFPEHRCLTKIPTPARNTLRALYHGSSSSWSKRQTARRKMLNTATSDTRYGRVGENCTCLDFWFFIVSSEITDASWRRYPPRIMYQTFPMCQCLSSSCFRLFASSSFCSRDNDMISIGSDQQPGHFECVYRMFRMFLFVVAVIWAWDFTRFPT